MKSKTVTAPPVRSIKFSNKGGFNPKDAALGRDTIPGPAAGAPLYQSRKVDDFTAKKTIYPDGIGPGAMTPHASSVGVLGGRTDTHMHPDLMSKAANEAASQHAIGNVPRGTIKR